CVRAPYYQDDHGYYYTHFDYW
nr:immunoglobulin heavy chain junction region [Macaca mulatta]MOY24667.1 immunoglobulin heavy chain junction region [Macaca mulatta]